LPLIILIYLVLKILMKLFLILRQLIIMNFSKQLQKNAKVLDRKPYKQKLWKYISKRKKKLLILSWKE